MYQILRYLHTTCIILGAPVLVLLIVLAVQRGTATLTCSAIGEHCERSLLHRLDYVIETVERGQDVAVKPNRK